MKNVFNISNIRWLSVSFVVMFLDLIMKTWVINHCVLGEVIYLIPGINFYYIHNTGIAFSLFSDFGIENSLFFVFFSVIVIIILLLMLMYNYSGSNYLFHISYAMIIGGALGNIYDRLCYGLVIDFIDCYIGNFHWPTFNFADFSVVVGMLLHVLNYKVYDK